MPVQANQAGARRSSQHGREDQASHQQDQTHSHEDARVRSGRPVGPDSRLGPYRRCHGQIIQHEPAFQIDSINDLLARLAAANKLDPELHQNTGR
ncbi:hypothetical protein [Pseudarthrobacter sp. S9]|uniref:hypothetical protein n=1 Tax=Pseudarthrobacter sp. S9 TaxID=3418421 RepID=UPI003D017283